MEVGLQSSNFANNKNSLTSVLSTGEFTKVSLLPMGSNMTYESALIAPDGENVRVVYKPAIGEAPLWDFPTGSLYKREYAAYLLSDILAWDLVPLTVIRDGPYGKGMVQKFIEHDPNLHYFTVKDHYSDEFKRIAAFDILLNNADRKSSHCIVDNNGRIWSIDHGVTFHEETKQRTVIWEYAGQQVPKGIIDDLLVFQRSVVEGSTDFTLLLALLHPFEQKAFTERLNRLLLDPFFPEPHLDRRPYPWPMV
jgi:uncharacterized repeat protein (TIGR03843 family)